MEEMEENIKKIKNQMSREDLFKEIFNEKEITLIQNIKKVIHDYKLQGKNVTVRIAGGWVRDKLLNQENNDIDLSIDGIDHFSFVKEIVKFYPESSQFSVFRGKKKSNQKEDKKLSISHVQLLPNFDIDVCNIETDPDENSVISNVEYDARRRDITINSLFYNLNTKEVEDLTGGISDLINKIIRVPNSIEINYSRDPFCFLRAFRFAARYDFSIQSEILNPSLFLLEKYKENLKVRPIAKELMKMISGNNIPQVFEWYAKSGIFNLIFDPQNKMNLKYDKKKMEIALERFEIITSNDFLMNLSVKSNKYDFISQMSIPEKYLHAKFLVVLSSIYYQKDNLNNEKIVIPKNLGISRDIINSVKKILKSTHELENMKNKELNSDIVGTWLMDLGHEWLLVRSLLSNDGLVFFDRFFIPFVFDQKFENIFDVVPLLNCFELGIINGLDITQKTSNKIVNDLINKLQIEMIRWQINNPYGTKEDYQSVFSNEIV